MRNDDAIVRGLYCSAAVIAVGSTVWLGLDANNNKIGYWHLAPLIGSIIVAIGWIVTTQTMIKTNMRQHTITVMLHYDSAYANQKLGEVIIEHLPTPDDLVVPGDKIPPYGTETDKFYRALDFELNRFDFMATGINSGVFDEGLIRRTLNSKFLYYYRCARPYIDYVQGTYKNKRIWGAFCAICEKWKATPLPEQEDQALDWPQD
jgi:hypothetical protein